MTKKRRLGPFGVVGGLIASLGYAALPVSAQAQTTPVANDQMKQLQDEIRKIQKE
jgi:hypothetical protein